MFNLGHGVFPETLRWVQLSTIDVRHENPIVRFPAEPTIRRLGEERLLRVESGTFKLLTWALYRPSEAGLRVAPERSGGNNSLLGRQQFPARFTGIRLVTHGNIRQNWRGTGTVSRIFPAGRELPRLGHRVEIVEEVGEPARIGLVHDRPGAPRCGDHVEAADPRFDPGDALRRHRQLAQPEPQEQRGIARVAGDLAADADRDMRRAAASTANWMRRSTAGCSGL